MRSQRSARAALERLFAIDLRSLAAFRLCIGLVLLADLAVRAGNLEQHYSDTGILPRTDFYRLFLVSPWHWSIHGLSGAPGVQALLLALAGAAALALTVGYRTRLATFLSWVLLASLHARNPMLQYGADHLLRMLLLWSMFLPLGSRWSLDQLRRGARPAGRHLSWASVAIMLQVFLLYSFSGVFKMNDAWFGGDALRAALSMDMYAKPLADGLTAFPGMLAVASPAIPWLELICALLLFVPVATLRLRALALVLLASFHLSVEFLLETGMFQYLSVGALLLFLPGAAWDWLAAARPVRSLRARIARGVTSRARGSTDCGEHVPGTSLRTFAQDAAQALCALLLIYVVIWNVCSLSARQYTRQHSPAWMSEAGDGNFRYSLLLPGYGVERMLGPVGWIGRAAQLHQRWNMFEEGGGSRDGWHVVVGTLEDGRRLSLLEGGLAYAGRSHPKPKDTSALYADTRWRVYFTYLIQASRAHELLPRIIARQWNDQHPDLRVRELEILHVQEPALPGGEGTARRITTWFQGSVVESEGGTGGDS